MILLSHDPERKVPSPRYLKQVTLLVCPEKVLEAVTPVNSRRRILESSVPAKKELSGTTSTALTPLPIEYCFSLVDEVTSHSITFLSYDPDMNVELAPSPLHRGRRSKGPRGGTKQRQCYHYIPAAQDS